MSFKIEQSIILLALISTLFGVYGRLQIYEIGTFSLNIIPTIIFFIILPFYIFKNRINPLNRYDTYFLLFFLYVILINFLLKDYITFPIFLFKFFSILIIYLAIKNFSLQKNQILKILFYFLIIFVIINTIFVLIYILQFFLLKSQSEHYIYRDWQYVFGMNLPCFTGLYESRTQFTNTLLVFSGLSLNLKLINKNNFLNNNLINLSIIFCLIFGLLSLSRGFFLIFAIMLSFYFFIILKRKFSIKKLFFSIILVITISFIILTLYFFGAVKVEQNLIINYKNQFLINFIDFITFSKRFFPIQFIFERSINDFLFGIKIVEEGIQTLKYGWIGFHNSFITIFHKYGLIGLILFTNLLVSFFITNKTNNKENNFIMIPLLGYIFFGFLHNNYNFLLIFLLISIQSQIFSRNE